MAGNNLIYSLKQDNRSDVLDFLSSELATVLKNNIDLADKGKYVLTNVPRRRASILNYGYDHSADLARSVSKKLGVKYVSVLKSKAKSAQKKLKGHERVLNADFDYKSRAGSFEKGTIVILIDDIVTSGASMSACATLLKGLGAKEVIAASIASVYNDWYI